MDYYFGNTLEGIIGYIPSILKAILLLLIAWGVESLARQIIEKLLFKTKVDEYLARGQKPADPEYGEDKVQDIAQIIYFLVFLLFIPSILDTLDMDSVSAPISNMMQNLLAFIPRLIGAGIILFIGYFIAKLLRDLSYTFLQTVNIDKWYNKFSPQLSDDSTKESVEKQQYTLANVLSKVVFGLFLIPVITMALETLSIVTLTEP